MRFANAVLLVALSSLAATPRRVDAFLAGNRPNVAFRQRSNSYTSNRVKTFCADQSITISDATPSVADVLSEDQQLHTAERLAGMSRGEISHIFEDVDSDGSGSIDFAELDLLSSYFGESSGWSLEKKKQMMADMDSDGNGTIDADEFYKWMVLNAKSEGTQNAEGSIMLEARRERLEVGKQAVPQKLLDLLEEIGVGAVVQKVTHPLHSGFGRTLLDHFVSCYILAEKWGNSKTVQDAAIFHALYQRGDGMRAVDMDEYRPYLKEKLGEDVEQLIYLFPSAHKSALLENGILIAPVGGDLEVPNVLEGGTVTIPEALRPALVELEVINSHDQHVLENANPVNNLWTFYQHTPAISLMSDGAKETIVEFRKRAPGACCRDIVAWHEGRFKNAGKEIPELWQKHIELFKEGGKFYCAEQVLNEIADENGDGEIDWEEFQNFDFDTCFVTDME